MFRTSSRSRLAAAAALFLAAVGAHAQTPAWSVVGSSGIADESSLNPPKFTFTNGGVFVKESSTGARSVVMRYNVGALPFAVVPPLSQPLIAVRYEDNSTRSSGGGNIKVVLKSVDVDTGLSNVGISTLDTDDFPASDNTQVQYMSTCGINWDFAHKSYYFEVTLTRDTTKAPDAQVFLQQIRMTDNASCMP